MGIIGYDYSEELLRKVREAEELRRKNREAKELRQQVLHDLIASGRSDVVLPAEPDEAPAK